MFALHFARNYDRGEQYTIMSNAPRGKPYESILDTRPTSEVNYTDDKQDVDMSYTMSDLSSSPPWVASRFLQATITSEDDNEVTVEIEVQDNINIGPSALAEYRKTNSPGKYNEFSDEITIKRRDMPLNDPNLDAAPRGSDIPASKMRPNVREWCEQHPFSIDTPLEKQY